MIKVQYKLHICVFQYTPVTLPYTFNPDTMFCHVHSRCVHFLSNIRTYQIYVPRREENLCNMYIVYLPGLMTVIFYREIWWAE